MIIRFNKKTRDDIVSIKTFISEYPKELDEIEFMDFIISYDYYPVYYKNYHIFRDLIEYHNSHLNVKKSDVVFPEVDQDLNKLLGI